MTPAVNAMVLPLSAPLVAAGGVNIDIDRTFLVQMVLFALLVVVLKPLLFDPVLRIFEEREKRTEGARAEARKMQEEAGGLLRKYEGELARVAQVASEERERLRAETARLEGEILEEARVATTRIIGEGRARIDAEVQKIQFDLGRRSAEISSEIAQRALGRGANG